MLKDLLIRQIQTSGPLGLDTYMQLCLHHDPHGFYHRGQGLGAQGDFITAPEISPLFGACLANWLAAQWRALGAPQGWRLVELGPGRGTLMQSVLEHLEPRPTALQFIEASPTLQDQVRHRLRGLTACAPDFFTHLGDLPASDLPTLILGNEYFDALPIRQFQRLNDQVAEVCVGLDNSQQNLHFTLRRADPRPCPLPAGADGIWEISEAAQTQMQFLTEEVRAAGGAALLIDYGYGPDQIPGTSTFQAVAKHEKVSPLATPGQADLTAHVDFGALGVLVRAAGLDPYLESQQSLLIRLGLDAMLETTPAMAATAARLVHGQAMGTLFQALSFAAPRP